MIEPPELSSIGDVYKLTWKAEQIQAVVDHIYENGRGDVTAEIEVLYMNGHLYHTRMNLLATTAKSALVRELKDRINNIEWQTVIEQACAKVLKCFRQGEPAIKLGQVPDRPAAKYILYPIIRDKEITTYYAEGGSAKSYLMYAAALSVQNGLPMLGFRPIKGNVLILDYETCKETAKERNIALITGMNLPLNESDMPFYRRGCRGLAQEASEIQRLCLEHDIKLVCVDSVTEACGGDALSQEVITAFFRALKTLKVAVLCIDHKPKGGNSIFGSVFKYNASRLVFEANKAQEDGEDYLDVAVYHTKSNDSKLMRPFGLHFDFVEEPDSGDTISVDIKRKDVLDTPAFAEKAPLKDRIYAELKKKPQSTKDLASELDTTENIIRATCSRNKGLFIKNGDIWGLIFRGEYV